ncbi:hypothetical protein KI387_025428, partial [Taxus chinensis]
AGGGRQDRDQQADRQREVERAEGSLHICILDMGTGLRTGCVDRGLRAYIYSFIHSFIVYRPASR